MALARVQGTKSVQAGGDSITYNITTPTVGNGLVILINMQRSGTTSLPSTCTDNQGNTYLFATQIGFAAGANTASIFFCPKIVTASGTFTITITNSPSAASDWVVQTVEYSGVDGGLALDKVATTTGSGSGITVGPTPALSKTEEIQAAIFCGTGLPASITIAVVSPVWVQEFEELPNTYVAGEAVSRIVTSATGTTASAAWTHSTMASTAGAIATFYASPSVSTKFYLTANTAPYTPATIRGAWDDSAGIVTRALEIVKTTGGTITSISKAETNVSGTWDVLLYRGVSSGLAAQTISGSVDLIVGVDVDNAAADFCWHVHIYVTQGNTDTPRGTLLTDYVEAITYEWPITDIGVSLSPAQALSSLAISAGDRLVVELGYIALNTVTTSRTGEIWYGTLDSSGIPLIDLQISYHPSIAAGHIIFDSVITEATVGSLVTQDVIETLSLPVPSAQTGQYAVEVLSATTPVPGIVTQYTVEILSGNVTIPPASTETTQFFIIS